MYRGTRFYVLLIYRRCPSPQITGLVEDIMQHPVPEPHLVDARPTPVSKPTVLLDIDTNTVNAAHSSFKRAPPRSPEMADDVQYLGMNVKERMIPSALPVSGELHFPAPCISPHFYQPWTHPPTR
jgi:hypothetical protein